MKTRWSFDDVPSQSGRTAIVTGANSGLGYQTASMLARRGAKVVLACRSMENAHAAAKAIREGHPSDNLDLTAVAPLDLSDLDSVEAFARKVASEYPHIDILVNNAGVMVPPFTRTKQGFELQFGVNHLGHFALTGRLLPLLLKSGEARIVSLSSLAAWSGRVKPMLEDPNYEHRRYVKWAAYGDSKLADQMFIQELARRLGAGSGIVAACAHPGVSATNLFKHSILGEWYTSHFSQSPAMGALSIVRAACGVGVTGGSYWGPGGAFEISGAPAPAVIPPAARKREAGSQLWELSERLAGVKYL